MTKEILVLRLAGSSAAFPALKQCLEAPPTQTLKAATCVEAAFFLQCQYPPHVVFTDARLSDGTWSDVLDLAAKASEPVNVIVVGPRADVRLYVDVIERGGFDFITPSFSVAELAHILRHAAQNVLGRREAQARLGLEFRPGEGKKNLWWSRSA